MAKAAMNDLLKRRMTASQQASELQTSDEAYTKLFREAPPPGEVQLCSLPLDKLVPFFTADIGFQPYTDAQLEAFAEQLKEDGLLVRIIVRPMPLRDTYEILAGHNRTSAAKLAGWDEIPAEIVEANDARAIVIATSTNLIQRQNLSIIERGKAYKALLDAKNRHGQWYIDENDETLGDNRQKFQAEEREAYLERGRQRYNARKLVAEFFGVTEYEIRKAVKLTRLTPQLQAILEMAPKRLPLVCADLMADYDQESQEVFAEICTTTDCQFNKATMQNIVRRCPPPIADRQDVFAVWREAQDKAIDRMATTPRRLPSTASSSRPIWTVWTATRSLKRCFWNFCGSGQNAVKIRGGRTYPTSPSALRRDTPPFLIRI